MLLLTAFITGGIIAPFLVGILMLREKLSDAWKRW